MPTDLREQSDAVRAVEVALLGHIAGHVDFSAGARALYATDASNYRQSPIGVVHPRTIEDVLETIRICGKHRVPLLPRGGGTSLAGQCCNTAVVIDMSRHLNRVLRVDAARRTATVEPGVVLDDLQRALEPYGLMYGPDPATHAWCTLGGMIGNNSCGVHSLVSGITANVVEELDVVTSDGVRMRVARTPDHQLAATINQKDRVGRIHAALADLRTRYADEIRTRYPKLQRRVSGYNLDALLPEHEFNLARALVGTEGTCVTVLEATVRLVPRPRAKALVVLGYQDIFAAADEVLRVLETKPVGLEAVDEVIVANLAKKHKLARELTLLPEGGAWLLVEFGADTRDEVVGLARALETHVARGSRAPATRVFTDEHEIESVWLIRESGLGATAFVPGEAATWEGWEDAAVPPEHLGAYLRQFRRLLQRYSYAGALYGHFGQGCVHTRTNFDLQSEQGIARFRAFIHEAADLVIAYGGSLSGEHGDGQARAELLPKMFGDSLVAAFSEFKRIWDPAGLMNPGKVVKAFAPTEHLRQPGYRPVRAATYFQFNPEAGIEGGALRCVGVGKCRKRDKGTMCPSYMVTGDEEHSTRGRAHLLFEMFRGETITNGWDSTEVKHALDLCLACKACKSECPVSVDMASYKAEFLAHHFADRARPIRAMLFGHIDVWAALGSRVPTLVNAICAMPVVAAAGQAALGIAPRRRLPHLARCTLQSEMARHPPHAEGPRVLLWSDTFTNYFYPDVGRAAVQVLEYLGYHVVVPPQTCCGRPLYDFGLLDSAREHLENVLNILAADLYDERVRLVMLEPSCFSVFRDEARNLLGDSRAAQLLARKAVLFDAFLHPHFERGDLPALPGSALVQLHCHEQALSGAGATKELLDAARLDAHILDAGCCGLAGAFGFDAQHYEVSLAIGERVLLPAIRTAPVETAIIANGFSCREQVRHGTGRRAWHFAEVVSQTLQAHMLRSEER